MNATTANALPRTMRAMVLDRPGMPLRPALLAVPECGPGQLLLRVAACGVCRTDLHIVDGELPPHRLPLVPGHEVVGTVVALGPGVHGWGIGDPAGVPWLGATCGSCPFCLRGEENLCDDPRFTGYDVDGGYAQYALADARFACALPSGYAPLHAAPLLCAGLIGYRAYAMVPGARHLGLYGFGAAAHLLAQLAQADGRAVHAFTRPGDLRTQRFALEVGAMWTGGSDTLPPAPLDAALVFAPDGAVIPRALAAVRKGGVVVCAGIHMSDIPSFPYALLWGERVLRSVANLTRADATAFMALASHVPLATHATAFALEDANAALQALRLGSIDGAAVLVP
jgi:propanol-preferring alcohol dehydrogenase